MQTTNLVNINIEYFKVANYALYYNGVPICRSLELTNESDKAIADLRVKCSGEFIDDFESIVIENIDPGETVRLGKFEVNPDAAKLADITERVVTDFKLMVTSKGELISEEQFPLELMPYDYWTGTSVIPQTIVSFITPNHPAISRIVVQSATKLKELIGSSSFTEYQTGNNNDVRHQVAAVFAAVHDLGIVYRSLPASYELIGQRVTMPEQVIASKIGNCIELTLLIASVFEAIGINCVIIFQKGHAFLGVWLVNDCNTCSVSDDVAFIEKKCSRGIDEMLVIECTRVTDENTSFEDALRTAEINLAKHELFDLFVDVKRSRLEQILPLPTRIERDGKWRFESGGVSHDSFAINVREHDRFDLSNISTTDKELTKFDIWERKLLDFSLRNSLLNLSLRRRAIQFISFDINRIEDHLQNGEEYCLVSKPNVEFIYDTTERLFRSKLCESLHELITTDIENHLLHSYFTESETKSILKNIYRSARNAIEETGANSLFLVIGTLRWFETEHSEVARYAPLLLLPVEMVYKKGQYFIRTRDEEISLNITLLEFIRQNYGIKFKGLDPLPLDESGVDVPLIFAIIRDALKSQKRWDVEEECLLGTFSFSKFLMWNDIHNHHEELLQNKIISSLLANRLTWTPEQMMSDLREHDKNVSPIETALPVAVDSSQMAAVIEGGRGNSFILYGPPGTGKSQTITNLIANALYHGKRVLFVAEKMAALSVVQSRLAKIGLDPFCLELHSNKSTKRHVLQQLEKALKVVHIVPPSEYKSQAEKIFVKRKEIIAYMEALHTVDPSDNLSLYDCITRYESINEEALEEFKFDEAINDLIVKEGVEYIDDLLGRRFETVIKLVGQPSLHPLNGLRVDREMLMSGNAIAGDMMAAAATLSEFSSEYNTRKESIHLRDKLLRDNAEALFEQDAEHLRQEWRSVKAKWFVPRFFAKRKFLASLRHFNSLIRAEEVDQLIEDLSTYQDAHRRSEEVNEILKRYMCRELQSEDLVPKELIDKMSEIIRRCSNHIPKMRDWIHWIELSDELRAKGLGTVVEVMESREYDAASMKNAFLKSLYKFKAEEKISKSEALNAFEGMLFDEKTARYKRLTEEFRLTTQRELYARLASFIPRMNDNASSSSEIGILNRNISSGGRGLSMRDLFDKLPTLLPRLCPCMLMSPMSVAQYIDLSAEKFDLVIFDEASQMPTSEAVGAIARGKSLIVVGDPKQMPPTSFFSSTNVDVEEAVIDDMESILEDCRTLEIPSLQLSWHYRSRHESLIAFSNMEYYDGSLITFPSVDDQSAKVHFVPINGFYDKGGKRCNRAEAEAIVDEIVRRLESETLREHSVGVIAFSVMQQGLIEDLLQERLDGDKSLQEALAQMPEPIFIKNLENVQGDERDVILFSIGYGPDKDGKISMNFGPLNNSGGERRLNVAVSRAREEMYVFSTLRARDIDLRRSKARGVEGLKHFLLYAETQSLPSLSQSGSSRRHSVIAEQISEELRNRGYKARTGIGRSQFRVDIAVEKGNSTGLYSLGILLDGEEYRDTQTTRDREVVQPSVLNALNWRVIRVWSVDWYNNKERVISRIVELLNETDPDPFVDEQPAAVFDLSNEKIQEHKSGCQPYVQYTGENEVVEQMDEYTLMRKIISVEQPVTLSYLCRRVAALLSLGRVTPTLQNALKKGQVHFFTDKSGALWVKESDSRDYPYYRTASGRDISDIPEIELVNAVRETLEEQLSLDGDSLTLLSARKLGFSRRGSKVDSCLKRVVDMMKNDGRLEMVGDKLRLRREVI